MMELLPELTMIPSLSPPFFTLLPSSALAANYQTSPKSNGRSSHGSSDVLEKDEKLCDYYRRMPVLYDKSHPHYKFQSKKEKAWRELSRLCEMDVEQCKKRMTYFRCRFTVERRIMKNGVNCSEWPLLEKLKFLNKHIKIRRPRAPNGEPEDTDDETNPMNILRKRQREQQEDAKDDLHAYLDLQQMAVAAQNPQAQLHYQQQLKLQGHGFGAHPGAPGFPPTDMSLHHLQPPPPHPQSHRDHSLPHQAHHQPGSQSGGAHPSQMAHGHSNALGHHPFRGGLPSSSSLHHQQQAAQQAAHQQQHQQQQQQAHHHHHHAAMHAGAGGLHGGSGGSSAGGHQQPTPAESPIPAISNVEASYSVPKRQRVSYDGDEASLSNFNLNRTVKYQNNLEHNANLDEHGAYGLYVGEVLRKLPERISSLTSLKIMQLLYEAQVQSFESTPSSATGSTTNGNTKKDTSSSTTTTTNGNGGGSGGGIGAVVTASLQNGAAGSSSEGRQSTESAESSKE